MNLTYEKRAAIFSLFAYGWEIKRIARFFKLKDETVIKVLRSPVY